MLVKLLLLFGVESKQSKGEAKSMRGGLEEPVETAVEWLKSNRTHLMASHKEYEDIAYVRSCGSTSCLKCAVG